MRAESITRSAFMALYAPNAEEHLCVHAYCLVSTVIAIYHLHSSPEFIYVPYLFTNRVCGHGKAIGHVRPSFPLNIFEPTNP